MTASIKPWQAKGMSRAEWYRRGHRMTIAHRYPERVEVETVCQHCGGILRYVKVTKPQKYHRQCADDVRLMQMRICNQLIRDLERGARVQ